MCTFSRAKSQRFSEKHTCNLSIVLGPDFPNLLHFYPWFGPYIIFLDLLWHNFEKKKDGL